MTVVLQVHRVEKRFSTVTAVDGLSFDVRAGEIFALLGPNGAGKSTVVRMLMGIIRPDAGTIEYGLGPDPQPVPAQLGYLPEERGLYQDVAIIRTLTYFGTLRGMRRGDARLAAERWLERMNLGDRAGEKLGALSKGNQQKVQFISAILHEPKLAILDEPFSGLDPVNQDDFLQLLEELRSGGMTILLSAHQMQLVERIADRIHLVSAGRTALQGTLEELREQSGHGDKLRIRTNGNCDAAVIAEHSSVERVTQSAESELTVILRPGASLSEILVRLGSSFDVKQIHSEELSLHDIFVSAVGAAQASHGDQT
jgi:ABC-2 type transport system ATP-binding protein